MTSLAIKQSHIMKGVPRCANGCAVSLAAMEAFPGYDATATPGSVILYHRKDLTMLRASMPWEGRRFVERFDMCEKVQPITLELEFYAYTGHGGRGTPAEQP